MSRVFLDANIWMYAAGPASPQREACVDVTRPPTLHRVKATTDAEVLQELLHRYWRLARPEIGIRMVRAACATLGSAGILPVTAGTVRSAADLLERYPHLSSRDLIHVAAMREAGVTRICSYDRGLDAVPGIQRLEPAAVLREGLG